MGLGGVFSQKLIDINHPLRQKVGVIIICLIVGMEEKWSQKNLADTRRKKSFKKIHP